MDVPPRVGPRVIVDLWYDVADLLAVEVINPSGSVSTVVDGNESAVGQVGEDMYEIDGVVNVAPIAQTNCR